MEMMTTPDLSLIKMEPELIIIDDDDDDNISEVEIHDDDSICEGENHDNGYLIEEENTALIKETEAEQSCTTDRQTIPPLKMFKCEVCRKQLANSANLLRHFLRVHDRVPSVRSRPDSVYEDDVGTSSGMSNPIVMEPLLENTLQNIKHEPEIVIIEDDDDDDGDTYGYDDGDDNDNYGYDYEYDDDDNTTSIFQTNILNPTIPQLPASSCVNKIPDQPLPCFVCAEPFMTTHQLKLHMRKQHSHPIECYICEMPFSNSYWLMKHLQYCHADIKPQCRICLKLYPNFKILGKHIKSHGVKQQPKRNVSSKRTVSNSPQVKSLVKGLVKGPAKSQTKAVDHRPYHNISISNILYSSV